MLISYHTGDDPRPSAPPNAGEPHTWCSHRWRSHTRSVHSRRSHARSSHARSSHTRCCHTRILVLRAVSRRPACAVTSSHPAGLSPVASGIWSLAGGHAGILSWYVPLHHARLHGVRACHVIWITLGKGSSHIGRIVCHNITSFGIIFCYSLFHAAKAVHGHLRRKNRISKAMRTRTATSSAASPAGGVLAWGAGT